MILIYNNTFKTKFGNEDRGSSIPNSLIIYTGNNLYRPTTTKIKSMHES